MLTVEKLNEYGADTVTGLKRCIDRESLYLKLVKTIPGHDAFEKLFSAVLKKDYEEAFQAAHGLKGVVGNLALLPLFNPIAEITELLRTKTDADYAPLIAEIKDKREKLEKICMD